MKEIANKALSGSQTPGVLLRADLFRPFRAVFAEHPERVQQSQLGVTPRAYSEAVSGGWR